MELEVPLNELLTNFIFCKKVRINQISLREDLRSAKEIREVCTQVPLNCLSDSHFCVA